MSANIIKDLRKVAGYYYRGLMNYSDLQRAVHEIAGDKYTAEDAKFFFRSLKVR